jgi:hypothetical protein
MIRNLKTMMDNLYERGRLDILRSIKDRVVRPLIVYEHWKTGALNKVPSIATLRPMSVMEEWVSTAPDLASTTRKSYTDHLKIFLDFTGRDRPIQSLPIYVEHYKRKCAEQKTYRSFDVVRAICQSYLHDARLEALWQAVKYIKPFRKKRKKRGRWEPFEFYEVLRQVSLPHQAILQSLAFTGMMPSEYWGRKWTVKQNGIQIDGTKTEYRCGMVPLVFEPVLPQRQQLAFRRALAKCGDYVPYDCRRGYAHWLARAKIPDARRDAYMRLAGKSIRGSYEEHEVDGFLKRDAAQLKEWMEDELKTRVFVGGKQLKQMEPSSPFLRWV